MSRQNTTRYAILGMLSRKAMSAYDIKKAMVESINYFWSESDGQLYPSLKRLTAEKFLTCVEETTAGGRSKKVYSITKQGLKVLKQWLASDNAQNPPRLEMLLKLFFSG